MKINSIILFSVALLLTPGCVPVNSLFDSARMLQKNQAQVQGCYSRYSYFANGETDLSNMNYGFRIAYGFCNRFNLGAHYELIDFPNSEGNNYNYFDLTPKYAFIPGWFAAEIPAGVYFADNYKPVYLISPRIIFTRPYGDFFETTLSAKTDISFRKGDHVPLGLNLGIGFSSNLNIWAIRPEAGYMIDLNQAQVAFTFGIGFNYNFNFKK